MQVFCHFGPISVRNGAHVWLSGGTASRLGGKLENPFERREKSSAVRKKKYPKSRINSGRKKSANIEKNSDRKNLRSKILKIYC